MTQRGSKITVDLGDEALYKAVKIAAVERRASLREIVVVALREWLLRQEEEEDLDAYREALGEPTRPFDEFRADLQRESGLREGVE